MERIIYSGNGDSYPVVISAEGTRRTLRFGTGERQSCLDLDQPHTLQLAYTRWMMTPLVIHPDPCRFLLCGLGGGSIIHFLLHHHPGAYIDVVEKDREVIHAATSYFRLPHSRQLNIFHMDVVDYLSTTGHSVPYDIAFIDIFGAGTMAEPLFASEFHRGIMERLGEEGIMAVNLWSGNRELFTMAVEAISEGCNQRLLQMPVKKRSNAVILAFAGDIPKKRIRKARKEAAIHRQRYGLPFQRYLKRLRRTNKPGSLLSLLR